MTPAATAIVAPTDISCPPDAAVTNVIPIASIASAVPLSRISTGLPENSLAPSVLVPNLIAKNDGSATRFTIVSINIAAIGINI